jgi:hypothetical protein
LMTFRVRPSRHGSSAIAVPSCSATSSCRRAVYGSAATTQPNTVPRPQGLACDGVVPRPWPAGDRCAGPICRSHVEDNHGESRAKKAEEERRQPRQAPQRLIANLGVPGAVAQPRLTKISIRNIAELAGERLDLGAVSLARSRSRSFPARSVPQRRDQRPPARCIRAGRRYSSRYYRSGAPAIGTSDR